jgi:hypothetical protein
MAKGDPSGVFAPQPLDRGSVDALAASVEREMMRVAAATEVALLRQVEFLHAEPPRPREGMVAGADGTDWNPGSGQGLYVYFAGAWQVLFTASSLVAHNSTTGKQGGTTDEYYHLTAAQHTDLTDGNEATVHHHDSRYDPAGEAAAEVAAHEALSDPHNGYVLESVINAKGDIFVGTADNTVDRLAVGDDGAYPRALSSESKGIVWQKNNFGASTAPTANDDSGDGYTVGSRWIDTTNDKEYVCLDATATAAVWTETTQSGGGGGGGGYDEGTSFPGSPSDNDKFFRTDLDMLFFYDGTRWLSAQQFIIPFQPYTRGTFTGMSATASDCLSAIPAFAPTFDFWMETLRWTSFVATTNNGTSFWRLVLRKFTAPNTATTIVQPDTSSDTASSYTIHETTINALLGTNVQFLDVSWNKVSSPGNSELPAVAVVGRIVAT